MKSRRVVWTTRRHDYATTRRHDYATTRLRDDLQNSDNGPVIAPEYHERIFGMFQTLQPRDQVEGSGIGGETEFLRELRAVRSVIGKVLIRIRLGLVERD